MKLLAQRLLARRRIVLIFLLAILLPALVVGYLSLRAFTGRREAIRRLLESHLYVSGESAVRAVEAALLEHERNALLAENFTRLHGAGSPARPVGAPDTGAERAVTTLPGKLFLLDDEYLVVVPRTGSGSRSISPVEQIAPGSEFSRMFRRGETYEYSRKDYSRAARAYRESAAFASTEREKAIALGAMGRCLIAAGKLTEARQGYEDLRQNHSRIQDRAGHFFGLTAALQIHEIEKRLKREAAGLQALLGVYQDLRDGEWPVSRPEYEFLASEIQALTEADLKAIDAPEIDTAYRALKDRPSPYLDALIFTEFLRRDVVPRIKERVGASPIRGAPRLQPDRLLTRLGDGYRLVSYSPLPNFDRQRTYYGGICWELEPLRADLLSRILGEVSKKLGLTLETIGESRPGSARQDDTPAARDALSLSFREFALPWKLRVTQPELEALEGAARRETLVYGALLAFVVVLMLFGAALLARDISRESETTRLRTEFVHNISHELKTPLTLIRLYGETLQRKENLTEEQRRESYEIITKESERLSHLIDNVLDSSRIDMGRKEFHFARGSLSRVVQETLDSYRYHLGKKGFQVHEEIASDLPQMAFDREAIAGALINLLANAMKFSPDRKDITVRLFRRGGVAVIQVEDRGIGIARQDLAGVFTRFYRAQGSVVSGTHGSGLGLSLVKHMAEAHGGSVEVESELGEGSVFSVMLPIATAGTGDAA
jgi:signal transduction histidine kinase